MKTSDLSKVEARINKISEEINKLLVEKVKDIKSLKDFLNELKETKENLLVDLKDKLLAKMPEIHEVKDHKDRIDIIEGYHNISKNIEGINKFFDINILIYTLEQPSDLNEYNTVLVKLLDLFQQYNLNISLNDFDLSISVKEYMKSLYENRDKENFLALMKNKFDELYWKNHDLLVDIVINIRLIIFDNIDAIIKYLNDSLKKYIEVNNINLDTVEDEESSLIREDMLNKCINPVEIMYGIKDNKYDVNSFSEDSSTFMDAVNTFVEDEYYEKCDKDEFINSIINLKDNLKEYKFYEKYKYLIDTISDINKKKEEYKAIYTTKKTNIKKYISEKNKIVSTLSKLYIEKNKIFNKEISFFYSEKKKNSLLEKINKKISDCESKLESITSSIKTEYNKFDLALFQEKSSSLINNGFTLLDDLKLFKNNVFVLKSAIKEHELNLNEKEINDIYEEFNMSLDTLRIQIINTFNFKKTENVADTIMNKYKLLDIHFELNIDLVDDLINTCDTILNSYYVRKSGLDPLVVKMVDKYFIKRNKETEYYYIWGVNNE